MKPMNYNENIKLQEDLISDYIDKLNKEKKPDYDSVYSNFNDDEDIEEMFELMGVVNSIKMVRSYVDIDKSSAPKKISKINLFKRFSIMIAIFLVVIFSSFIFKNMINSDNNKNIAYALINAYTNINGFIGEMHIEIRDGNDVLSQNVQIMYKDTGEFYSIHHLKDNKKIAYLYNGSDLLYRYEIDGSITMENVDAQSKDMFMDRYLLYKNVEDNIDALSKVEKTGSEKIAGRATDIYEFKYYDEDWQHNIWIDKELGVALKEVFIDQNGMSVTSEYIGFEPDEEFDLPATPNIDNIDIINEEE